jgi:hypothetical protein
LLNLIHRTFLSASVLAAIGGVSPVFAQAPVGTLDCNVAPSTEQGLMTTKLVSCIFHSVNGYPEKYTGTLSLTGLDIGMTNEGRLSWAVVMAAHPEPYALAGTYSGASAGLTILGGANANALVSTSGNSVSLQPVSVSMQSGLNLTAGVGSLTLAPAYPDVPPPPRRRHHS